MTIVPVMAKDPSPPNPHTHTIVFLHGRGDNAVSLQTASWFDVWDVRDFASLEDLQTEGLREVVPEICDLLAREAAALGGRYDRVVLAGISMGAATGAHVLFNLDILAAAGGRLGAFIGFSGRCPFSGRSLTEMRKTLGLGDAPSHDNVIRKTPMLLEHCVDDPVVTKEWMMSSGF
ncbi:hypothetical protein NKR23_g7963 [Pleurostoma richardsiae]|uniref:Phospholipase/carboxylesterase/thioesterase domain-containing protein n=1 Tax=Pleurostoma richardsiae TaxID=41990 RepID=A0AA38RKF9_9PEZI|nr:hypothetical protein NKR23_g7963 [Pleurostoma richardsiae]